MRFESVTNAVTKAAYFTTDVAGALGGMTAGVVVGGVKGGLDGAKNGVRTGMEKGTESPVTSAATMAVLGVSGVVGWPIVAAVGGPALAVRMLRPRPGSDEADTEKPTVLDISKAPRKRAPKKTAATTG